ncbi:MAG: YabP/YqfC family sporulation protein [Clostridia bacterium]|nr:YabP/YqfC family sporulation protein [Clostridia bacterium]
MKTGKKQKQGMINRLEQGAKELVSPSMFISSNSELSFYRCTGLKEYSKERVVLDTDEFVTEIIGNDLELMTFSTSEITVNGRIKSVSFTEHNGGHKVG